MKKRFAKIVTCTGILSLVFLVPLAFAQPVGVGEDMPSEYDRKESAISDIADELGLTDEQKAQLKEHRFQEKYNKTATRNQMKLKQMELYHELEKEELDTKTIDNIVSQIKELQGTQLEQRVNSIVEMRKILTPEQFEKLQSVSKRKMRKAFGGRSKGQQEGSRSRMGH